MKPSSSDAGLRVLEAGRSCVQDHGRTGWNHVGVSLRGSSDPYSADLANALVGNDRVRPLIEVTALDFSFEAQRDLLIAVTGADCDLTVDGSVVARERPIAVASGSVVRLARVHDGLRCYVGINGQLVAPSLLGSVSPDPSLDFGWYLAAGDVVPVWSAFHYYDHPYYRIPLMRPPVPYHRAWASRVVRVTVGPEWEDFKCPQEFLEGDEFEVGQQSNEVGLQLHGTAPPRLSDAEMRSRGVSVGAIEVTPSGDLIALLRGRLVTAGYPVVAVATRTAQSVLGQLRPGDRLRFDFVTIEEAVRAAREERTAIEGVAASVRRIAESVGITLQGPR